MQTIGIIHSDYTDKFATPRQPGLATNSQGYIEISKPFNSIDFFVGFENFSHFWIIFKFNLSPNSSNKTQVRPPRLGGNDKLGVFASRSNFRPNNLGMSVVKFEKIENLNGKILIHFSNHDIVSGTEVVDIKPYLPYADCIGVAKSSFEKPSKVFNVIFEENINQQIEEPIKNLLIEILSYDPRPAYHSKDEIKKQYNFNLREYEITFEVNENQLIVIGFKKQDPHQNQ